MVPVAYFFLPDSPQSARFLNEEEKRVAVARGVRQTGTTERVGRIKFKDVGLTFIDPKAITTALMYFSCNVSFSSLPVFLPTILEEMGFESITAQGLSAPPYFLSFLITIGSAWIADRTQQRGLTIIILSAVGGVGYIMLAVAKSTGARYTGVFLAASGVFPCIANILPWVTNNQGNDDRRGAAFVLLNVIGYVRQGYRFYRSRVTRWLLDFCLYLDRTLTRHMLTVSLLVNVALCLEPTSTRTHLSMSRDRVSAQPLCSSMAY